MTDGADKDIKKKGNAILRALADRDNSLLLSLLDEDGGDADWCDDRGQTLLHFAALRGDEELCDALIFKKRFNAAARTEDGDTPARLAAVFGHQALAESLRSLEARGGAPATTLPPVKSLQDLRTQGAQRRRSMFYLYACHDRFSDVVAAALKGGEKFQADDLLTEGQPGESVVVRLCQTDQIDVLINPKLWRGNDALLAAVRAHLPKVYRARFDHLAGVLPATETPAPASADKQAGPVTRQSFRLGRRNDP